MSFTEQENSMRNFTGSVALITGGNKGLGFEIARQLGKQGVRVVIGSRDPASGEAAAAKLRDEKIDARSVKLDVVNAADVAALPAFFQKNYSRLDILVNNAGTSVETGGWKSSTAGSITLD